MMTAPPRAEPLFVVAILAAGLFAGCTAAPEDPASPPAAGSDDPVVATSAGPKPASAFGAADVIETPSWRPGKWFGVHVWRSDGPSEGRHYDVVVVEETDEAWILAPDDRDAAVEDAAFDLPVVGAFDRATLATTGYGTEWDLYMFPLQDGATWSREVTVREVTRWEPRTYDVTFTARFAPQIDVLGVPRPGLVVTGTLADGTVLIETDYVPAIGWYSRLVIHNVETVDPSDFLFSAESMGSGDAWSGVYHTATAALVMDRWQWFVAFAPHESSPHTGGGFTVPEGTKTLYGFVVSFAYQGLHETALIDPAGRVREQRAMDVGPAAEGDVAFVAVDEAAEAGDWMLVLLGAGLMFAGGAVLWAVNEAETPFSADAATADGLSGRGPSGA